jgi:hypothetical protein
MVLFWAVSACGGRIPLGGPDPSEGGVNGSGTTTGDTSSTTGVSPATSGVGGSSSGTGAGGGPSVGTSGVGGASPATSGSGGFGDGGSVSTMDASVGVGGAAPSGSGGAAGSGVDQVDASCGSVAYASNGFYGPNVLYSGNNIFVNNANSPQYDFLAEVAPGASVTIKMTGTAGDFRPVPGADGWGSSDSNWLTTTFDFTTGEQTFKTRNPYTSEARMVFLGTGKARIDYFECGSSTPTRTKTIAWGPAQP